MDTRNEIVVFKIEEQMLLEMVSGPDQELYKFKIEILRNIQSGVFSGRIYRQDCFRLKLFGSASAALPFGEADHEVWVVDDHFSADEFVSESMDGLREQMIESIKDLFQQRQ